MVFPKNSLRQRLHMVASKVATGRGAYVVLALLASACGPAAQEPAEVLGEGDARVSRSSVTVDSPLQAADVASADVDKLDAQSLPEDGEGRLVVDAQGRHWRARRARISSSDEVPSFPPVPTGDDAPGIVDEGDLRAVMLADGIEYREVALSSDFAEARAQASGLPRGYPSPGARGRLVAPPAAGIVHRPDDPLGLVQSAPSSALALTNFDVNDGESLIVGTDDRYYVSRAQRTQWPKSAQVNMAGCSATMIGRYTAIGAAHCFWDRKKNKWTSRAIGATWALGQVRYRDTSADPYNYYYSYAPTTGCYTVTIPAAFQTGNSVVARADDFAIIEFTCGLQPGTTTGWLWPGYGNAADYHGGPQTELSAYDNTGILPPNSPTVFGNGYSAITLIGRNVPQYNTILQPNGVHLHVSGGVDASGGSSGGGLLQAVLTYYGDTRLFWIGNVIGPASNGTNKLEVRNLTAGSWGFIVANSTEY